MHRKLKILYTIPNFDTAGSGKVLYDLAKGLNKEDFEVAIACKHNKGLFFKDVEALGLPIYFMDSTVPLRPYFSLFYRIRAFKKLIKTHKFDIVHSWHWSSDWSEILAVRSAGAKFIYTKKAMTWGNIHWKIRSYLSHFIITVNRDMRQYFPYKKNQELIPFGLDMAGYDPQIYWKDGEESVFKVITVANLVPVKNIEVTIKAIHHLENSNIHLDIIGDDTGSYAHELKELVRRRKLERQIKFLGKQNDVRSFLANADLYIISSKKEGMPMALVEAMAMQIPVLGADAPGINYVLKDFPQFLFEANNCKKLSTKIEWMLKKTDWERQEAGQELRDYCNSNFSIKRFINEHENLYLRLGKSN